jgi:hypothetical protein
MKTLNPAPKFLIYAVLQAIRHPRTPITYLYCPECRVRLRLNEKECPVCRKKAGNSPEGKQESPIPWWGSVLVIIIGIACWCVGGYLDIAGLDEAGRALVYIPLGSLFGMSLPR